ncbi:DMT family transporter [Oceanobacillus halotolerans]|uniref:DMT family transporter n=1 Tax=Oceanobacillus halotolerans TaxID=2663380 RepID=UPI0013D9D46B|nr:DMT family transporter [Oceanobacillus halotolerans]
MWEGVDDIYSYILLIFVVIFFAGNILTGKAINELPPFTIAFFRLVVAFIVLFPIGFRKALQYREQFMAYKKPFLIMTLSGITFFNTLIYAALQFTTSTNVSVLETAIPVVTVLLSAIILKEHIQSFQWIGMIISIIGAVWVVIDGNVMQLLAMDWNVGDGIMILAIGCWAIYSVFVKQYMPLFPSYAAMLVMTGISVIVLFPFVMVEWLVVGIPTALGSNAHIGGLIYLGIFPSFIAILMYNHAVQQLGASKASIFLNFLPVVTMIGASVWLGETVTGAKIVGALAVMGGVMLTTHERKSKGNQQIKERIS